jgi:beta-hydroxyacyl-ACP dehydratase FabZ
MQLSIHEIMAILPHRYPFLLVDRIVELVPMKKVVGIKNVTFNEEFFLGHFPGNPVMPGVLIIEAMAQTAAVGLLATYPESERKLLYLTGINDCRFRRPVTPGDQLRIDVDILMVRSRLSKCHGVATVDGAVCAEAEILSGVGESPAR